VFAERVTSPQLKCDPSRLQFAVRINNKLPRVFRGQGSVVQFNVAGKIDVKVVRSWMDVSEFQKAMMQQQRENMGR
jgi:hypothetical protein